MTRRSDGPAADGTPSTWHDGKVTAPLTPHDPPPHGPLAPEHAADERDPGLRTELREAAVVAAAVAVAGVLLGLLWVWLAPRVPLISDGRAVYLKNSEGEQAIGADGTFALLALGFGVLSSAVVFWFRRRGGIPLVAGLALGSLLAALIGWRLGVWLGPSSDVVATAKSVGKGVVFDAPLKLGAKGVLLAWPLAAMAVHLGLTAAFGPRDPEPEPHWPGAGPAADAG
ncbi:ABC transporter permease [Streptomyces sp. NPDC020799]|uniref:ABC transporter permease n=1 Tax=Streptomyces sp. NPDC020799 TaxID=3365091 RepID=UPI00379165B8